MGPGERIEGGIDVDVVNHVNGSQLADQTPHGPDESRIPVVPFEEAERADRHALRSQGPHDGSP